MGGMRMLLVLLCPISLSSGPRARAHEDETHPPEVSWTTLSRKDEKKACKYVDGIELVKDVYEVHESSVYGGQEIGKWKPNLQPWEQQRGRSLPLPSLSHTASAIEAVSKIGTFGRPGFNKWTIGYGDTLLAPTDYAWLSTAAFLGTTVEGLFADPLAVRDILLNLMFQGKVLTENLVDGNLLGPTLLDTDLQVLVDSYARGGIRDVNFRSDLEAQKCLDPAKVVVPNLELCKGTLTIQVINQIPLPGTCDVFPRVIDIACTTPELSLYCEALQLLGDTLGASFNLAPTDAAWRRAFEIMHLTKRQVFNDYELLRNIVNFNRSPTKGHSLRCSIQFRDGEAFIPTDDVSFRGRRVSYVLKVKTYSVLERLCGDAVKGVYPGRRVVVSSRWGSAVILTPEAVACGKTGSSVYLTDEVLLPPTFFYQVTLLDIVCADPYLQLFCSFVKRAGGSTTKLFLNPSSQATVFAPTDAAIRLAFQSLNLGPPERVSSFLARDIVSTATFTGEGLFLFDLQDGFLSGPTSRSSMLYVEVIGPKWMEHYFLTGNCNKASVLRPFSNKKAVNGVVHVLDTMLTPPSECKTICELLELNPATNLYAVIIYALGFEFEFCASSATCFYDYTSFAPSDLALLELFYEHFGTHDVQNVFQYYTPFLYDIVGYHTILDVLVYTTPSISVLEFLYNWKENFKLDIPPGIVRFPEKPRFQEYDGLINAYWKTRAFITSTRMDSIDSVKGIVTTNVTLQGQSCSPGFTGDGSKCPAKIISADNYADNGVLQVIDRVLLWPKDPECQKPVRVRSYGNDITRPSVDFLVSIFADVRYEAAACSVLCFPGHHDVEDFILSSEEPSGYWETFLASNRTFYDPALHTTGFDPVSCNLCGPFGAQVIYGQVVDELKGLVLVLYVNNLGEVRFGIVPGFSEADWTYGDFAIRPFSWELIGPSIVASNFIALPGERFTVLATYNGDCAVAKIYINGVLRGAAVVDFFRHRLITAARMVEDVVSIYEDAVKGYIHSRQQMVKCVLHSPPGSNLLDVAKCLFHHDGRVVYTPLKPSTSSARVGKWTWNDQSLNAEVVSCLEELKNSEDVEKVYLGDIAQCFAPLMPQEISQQLRSDDPGGTKHALNSWHAAYVQAEECIALRFSEAHDLTLRDLKACLASFADLVDLSATYWVKVQNCMRLLYASDAGLAPGDLRICMKGSVPEWFLVILSEVSRAMGIGLETYKADLEAHWDHRKNPGTKEDPDNRGLMEVPNSVDFENLNWDSLLEGARNAMVGRAGSSKESFEQLVHRVASLPALESLEMLKEGLKERLSASAAEAFATAPPWRFGEQPENIRDFSIFNGRGPITAEDMLKDSGLPSQWSWLFGIPPPALKENTAFYENCGSSLNQYSEAGDLYEFAACGFSALSYIKWQGEIFQLLVYEEEIVYPSTCKFSNPQVQPLCKNDKACPYPSYHGTGKILAGNAHKHKTE